MLLWVFVGTLIVGVSVLAGYANMPESDDEILSQYDFDLRPAMELRTPEERYMFRQLFVERYIRAMHAVSSLSGIAWQMYAVKLTNYLWSTFFTETWINTGRSENIWIYVWRKEHVDIMEGFVELCKRCVRFDAFERDVAYRTYAAEFCETAGVPDVDIFLNKYLLGDDLVL